MKLFNFVGQAINKLTKIQKIFLLLALLILVFVPLSVFVASRNKMEEKIPSSSSKMWEIVLEYNTESKNLIVKRTKLLEGKATSSQVGLSPYRLKVLDNNNKVIYETDIHIAEEIVYNIYIPPEATQSGFVLPPQPKSFENIVYVPYFSNAKKAEILKNDVKVLEFTFPKSTSFNIVKKVFAQSEACTTNVKIVFISDGFTDEAKYNQIVSQVTDKFQFLSPYIEKPGMLEIQSIFNTEPLGCTNGQYMNINCFDSPSTWNKIRDEVFGRFPNFQGLDSDHLKLVILTDTLGHPQGSGQILGAFNGKGGNLGIFATKLQLDNVAPHEVLGHGVGYLWDRYIYGAGNSNADIRSSVSAESNCSDKPAGQDFWVDITGGGGYPGCTSQYLYAPYSRDCGASGYSNSLMSTATCGHGEFDPVEKAWLRTQILPKYQSCSTAVTPLPTIPNVTIAPSVTSGPVSYSIFGYAFEDTNDNKVKDAGEQGIAGVEAAISGTSASSRNTGGDGYYEFGNLSQGTYNLVFNLNGQIIPDPNPIRLTSLVFRAQVDLILTNGSPSVGQPTPQPTSGASPTQPASTPKAATPTTGGGSGEEPSGSEPVTTYNCKFDPKCATKQNNLQLCPLICTPN